MIQLPPGLIIPRGAELRAVLEPLASELPDCFWVVETQSGPFHDGHIPERWALYESLWLDTDACRDTSCSTWRPGTLPEHADQLVVDEGTYLFALRCDESDVGVRTAWLMPHIGRFDTAFFAGYESVVDLFVMHVDGWWELYTRHREWHRRVRLAFPDSFERSVTQAGEPPGAKA